MLRAVLSSAGHDVVTAENGVSGLELAIRLQPDLILMDIEMPLMGGLAVCEELKREECTARVPVWLMTGRPSTGILERARTCGALGVLNKPFLRDTLLQAIDGGLALGKPNLTK